jgi:hypothetical protein
MKRFVRGLVALATLASLFSAGEAAAQVQDPSRRPARPASKVGWYMRAGLGIGYDSATVLHRVDAASESSRGIGQLENRHSGHGVRLEAIGALRLNYQGLLGIGYILGQSSATATASPPAEALRLRPGSGREWWLVGPSGGVQFDRGPTWTLGGMLGWGKSRSAGFIPEEGTRVNTTMVHESMLGVSVWAGPSWTLGRGWMLGAHGRITALRSDLQLLGRPDTASEFALLADISFQSP